MEEREEEVVRPVDMDPVAVRARHIDHIKQRHDRGDMIFSRNSVGVLLKEIEELSELLLAARKKAAPTKKMKVGRCTKQAHRGTGTGICDTVMTLDGYCPRWSEHLEEG